jgi:hypothetical protein
MKGMNPFWHKRPERRCLLSPYHDGPKEPDRFDEFEREILEGLYPEDSRDDDHQDDPWTGDVWNDDNEDDDPWN